MVHRTIVSVLFVFLLFGCKKNPTSSDNNNSSITIEWAGSYQTTYSYSGGVLSGQNVFRSFTVISGSGDLKITAEVTTGDGNKKSFTGPVEEGEKYSFKVSVSKSVTTKSCTPNVTASRITLKGGNGPSTSLSFACGNDGRGAKTLTIGELKF